MLKLEITNRMDYHYEGIIEQPLIQYGALLPSDLLPWGSYNFKVIYIKKRKFYVLDATKTIVYPDKVKHIHKVNFIKHRNGSITIKFEKFSEFGGCIYLI